MNNKRKSPAVREVLRRLENPYASLQLLPEVDSTDTTRSEAQSALFHLSENPYASHFYWPEPDAGNETATLRPPLPAAGHDRARALSKAAFRAQCSRIFRPYIPALEKGRLRAQHRDFIERNESRPSDIRFALLEHLKKYDLSSITGLTSQFNRERDVITEEKLADIERSVGIKD